MSCMRSERSERQAVLVMERTKKIFVVFLAHLLEVSLRKVRLPPDLALDTKLLELGIVLDAALAFKEGVLHVGDGVSEAAGDAVTGDDDSEEGGGGGSGGKIEGKKRSEKWRR